MVVFLVIFSVLILVALIALFKLRRMPEYKIVKILGRSDYDTRWFVKVRKGFRYKYLKQTEDGPGYENDKFETSKFLIGGQETEKLAEKVVYNHRLTTIDGIEREGV